MIPSLLAILARFNGNRNQAWAYCMALAIAYPHLTEEYSAHMEVLNATSLSHAT
jgi:hypothetical protein